MLLTIIGLVITNIATGAVVFNLLRKLEFFEDWRDTTETSIASTILTMQNLDNRQLFEKDDEVGVVFQDLKDALYLLRPYSNLQNIDDGTSRTS